MDSGPAARPEPFHGNGPWRSVPFFLVTGFLGAGKTTLLKNFIQQHAADRRLLVVQNEFAASGVDARELRSVGKSCEIMEVQGGSVFCVCRLADFRSGLAQVFHARPPEAVMLEATGLADPIAVMEMLEAPELRPLVCLRHVWCVVDAAGFQKMSRALPCVRRQVRVADTVVVNKSEKVSDFELAEIRKNVRGLNPWAEVHAVSHCRVALGAAFAPLTALPVAARRAVDHAMLQPSGRPAAFSLVLRSARPLPRAPLKAFVEELAGRVWRLKGYLCARDGTRWSLQAAGGMLQMQELPAYDGQTELVLVAADLDEQQVRKRFAVLSAQAGD